MLDDTDVVNRQGHHGASSCMDNLRTFAPSDAFGESAGRG